VAAPNATKALSRAESLVSLITLFSVVQHWLWHIAHEVRNETEILLDLFEDLFPSYRSRPFSHLSPAGW